MEGTAGVAWRTLADSLIAGITHDLNGRLTAMAGVAHLTRTLPHVPTELADILDDQATRLAESVRMLRALPMAPPGEAELLRVSDVLAEVAVLYRVRSGPEPPTLDVSGDHGVVVRAAPGALAEAVLLLMAATEPRTATRGGRLILRHAVEEGTAYVRIEAATAAATSTPPSPGSGRWPDPAAAAEEASVIAERFGGRVLRSGAAEPTTYEIQLPAVMP
jgi:hypothetical protein